MATTVDKVRLLSPDGIAQELTLLHYTDQRHRGRDGQDAEEQGDQLSLGPIEGEARQAEARIINAFIEWGWWRL